MKKIYRPVDEIISAMTQEQVREMVGLLSAPRNSRLAIIKEMSTESLELIEELCMAEVYQRGGVMA